MIRINLLPFRAARKQENIRRQVSIYFLSVIFLITLMVYFYLSLSSELTRLKGKEEELRREMASYSKITREMARIRRRTKEIQDRFNVITDLEKQRSGPVRLLEEIATSLPVDRLWLNALSEKEGVLTIEGSAMDNDTVALFMTNLEKKEEIKSVDLKTTKLKNFPEYKLNTADFVLTCRTIFYKDKSKTATDKGRSGKRS